MTKIILATRNEHKLGELRAILAAAGIGPETGSGTNGLELVGAAEFDLPDVVEDGLTFAANAMLKAVDATERTGLPAIADDSGICVDALNGMPGIFSARWAGRHGQDAANLDLLLAQLSDIADEHRGTHFVCAAALALPGGERVVREGRVTGRLLRERRGEGGFGYDPVFLPDGFALTTAELTAEQKNAISHRGRAFQALAADLSALVG